MPASFLVAQRPELSATALAEVEADAKMIDEQAKEADADAEADAEADADVEADAEADADADAYADADPDADEEEPGVPSGNAKTAETVANAKVDTEAGEGGATPGGEALERDGDSPDGGAAAAGSAGSGRLVFFLLLVALVAAGLVTFAVLFAEQDKNTTLSPSMSPSASPSTALSFSPTTTPPLPFLNNTELSSAVSCFLTSDGTPNPVKWNSAGESGCTGLSSCGTGTNLSCSEVYG